LKVIPTCFAFLCSAAMVSQAETILLEAEQFGMRGG
jgi:hypothetical protein